MRTFVVVLCAGMSAALFTVQPATAIPVTFVFEGVIDSIYRATSTDPFGSDIEVGNPFSGRYTYDTTTPNGGTSSYGVYIENSPLYGIDVQIGSFSGSSATALTPLNYRIIIDGLGDDNVVQDIQTQDFVFGGVNAYLAQIFLKGPSSSLSDVGLTASAPNILDYFTRTFVLGIGPPTHVGDVIYQGTITSIYAVPEPPVIGLIPMVILGGFIARFKTSATEQ